MKKIAGWSAYIMSHCWHYFPEGAEVSVCGRASRYLAISATVATIDKSQQPYCQHCEKLLVKQEAPHA